MYNVRVLMKDVNDMNGSENEELSFKDFDLSPEVRDSLKKMGVKKPTTIQQKAIPLLMDDLSLIAKAPTGTGKTFAFAIPILEYLNMNVDFVQALILCPTRELALQITSEFKNLGRFIKKSPGRRRDTRKTSRPRRKEAHRHKRDIYTRSR